MNEVYIIFGKLFIGILIFGGWFTSCYLMGLFLYHRKYLLDKIGRFILKYIYRKDDLK